MSLFSPNETANFINIESKPTFSPRVGVCILSASYHIHTPERELFVLSFGEVFGDTFRAEMQ